jgi:peptidoglycan/LPS O-acetylase OafA/YrhL
MIRMKLISNYPQEGESIVTEIVTASPGRAPDAERKSRRTTERRFSPALEGMRGLLTLCVVFNHTAFTAGQIGYKLANVPKNGFIGVLIDRFTDVSLPMLFVLSGMLLYRPYALSTIADTKSPALGPYFWRRALRTFPAYWLCTVVVILSLNHSVLSNAWYWIRALLMLQVYQSNAMPSGMEQSWSMATDMAFYLTLPIFAVLFTKFAKRSATPAGRARRLMVPLLGIIAAGYLFNWYDHLPFMGVWPNQNNWPLGWMGFVAIGMVLATLSASFEVSPATALAPIRWINKWPIRGWVISLILTLLWCFSPLHDQGLADYRTVPVALVDHGMELIIAFLMMAPLALPHINSKFIDRVLTFTPLRLAGQISYGLYLWHIAFIYYFNGGLMGASNFWGLFGEVMAGSLGAALISFFAVERPAQKLRRRLGKATVAPSVEMIAATEDAGAGVSAPAPQARTAELVGT